MHGSKSRAAWTRWLVGAGTPLAPALLLATLLVSPRPSLAQARATAVPGAADSACRPGADTLDIDTLAGQPIRSVRVVTAPPLPLPSPAAFLDNLHVRTRESTVRRRLLFAAGDSVVPWRIAESVRRLRQLHYLADVLITAARCERGGVALTVATRDAWSTRPTLKAQGSRSARMGLEERNLFGTGRTAQAYFRSDYGRLGVGVSYMDPWVLGSDWQASVAHDAYRDGASWEGLLQTRERSVFDRWHAELSATHSVRRAPAGRFGVVGDSLYRDAASVLVRRSIAASPSGVTSLLAGAELDHASVVAGPAALIVGPSFVRRTFVGLDIGAARRTARYVANDWLVGGGPGSAFAAGMPASAVAQLPAGFEEEGMLGVGRDLATGRPALHLDLWAGRIWAHGRNLVVRTDAWASGFRVGTEWTAASIRGTIGVYRPAPHGLWSTSLSVESLTDPDPDVRALAAIDPILRAVTPRVGLAETAVGISIERSRRFVGAWHGYALDGSVFAAGSSRWEGAASASATIAGDESGIVGSHENLAAEPGGSGGPLLGAERMYIGVAGAGLQFSPLHFGRASLRLDVGVPLLHSIGVRGRPYIALSIVPALTAARRRDGGITSW
jgi:hypothetical protein